MIVEAGLERALSVGALSVASQRDETLWLVILTSDEACDLVAVEDRQAEVDEGEIGMQAGGGAHAFGAVGRLEHLVPFVLEEDLQHLPRVVVVFHDEHATADDRTRWRLTIDVRRDLDARQANGEDAAESGAWAFGLHGPAVQLDECPDEREADAQTTLRAIRRPLALDEQAEDQWKDVFG